MPQHVFIASSTFAEYDDRPLKILNDSGLKVTINLTKKRLTSKQLIEQAFGADAAIAGLEIYDAQVLEHLKKLRCISRCGVGLDNIDLNKAKEKNITVFNTPDVVTQPVAELTIAMILDLLRRVTMHALLMREKKWERRTGNLLLGKKVGVIGLGRIGRRVAELLRAWGIEVIGTDIRPDEKWAKQQGVGLKPLEQVLSDADIITLHLSMSQDHPFCLGQSEISRMKKGAFLINLARGALINEPALYQALISGHLAGAGLDVFEQEPYTGPLCGLDNVILTPHLASLTQESRLAMEIEAAENIINFFNK
jgi:D-3-phosphoglycerate dehydrogenase